MSSDEVKKFYFSFEQVLVKHQTGTYRVVKHSVWEPPTDVAETPEAVHVRVEIAGMRNSKIDITLLDNMLIISGSRPRPGSETPPQAIHQMEIAYSEFRKAVMLPFAVNPEAATAHYTDGFLDIILPRAENT